MMMHSLIVLEFAVIPRPIEPDLVVGCSSDDECPDYNSCRNKQCIDPCILDDPCAINAFCKVVGHEPECKCPEGFFGDPRVECKPRKRHEKICSFESFVHRFFCCVNDSAHVRNNRIVTNTPANHFSFIFAKFYRP